MNTLSTTSTTADSAESTLVLGERLARHAVAACDAVGAINRVTADRPPIPGPIAYELFGAVSRLGYALQQALVQLSAGLGASLEAPGLFEVYESDGTDPATSVEAARAALNVARGAAEELGTAAEHAQGHLAWQGFRPAATRPAVTRPVSKEVTR